MVGDAAQQAAVSRLQGGNQQRQSHPAVRQGQLQPGGPQVSDTSSLPVALPVASRYRGLTLSHASVWQVENSTAASGTEDGAGEQRRRKLAS